MNAILEDRPALVKVQDWWLSDCPQDVDVINEFFTGATGAEIGRRCGFSRERARQRLHQVFEAIQINPYFHTLLFSQQVDNLIAEFQNNPSSDLYPVYSKILSLFSSSHEEYRNIDMGWIPTSLLVRTEGELDRKPFLLPTHLIEKMNHKVVYRNGLKKLDVDTVSLISMLPDYDLNGFFTVDNSADLEILNLIPESIVTFNDNNGSPVYIRPHRIHTLKKQFLAMLDYYPVMSLARVVDRLYDLTCRRKIKGEWSKEYIEAYIRSIPEAFVSLDDLIGMVGPSRKYQKTANFRKIYKSPDSKSKLYQKEVADIVNRGNATYKSVLTEVFDGDIKLLSTWFSHVVLKNPLILLTNQSGQGKMTRYEYLSLKIPHFNLAGMDYGKAEQTVLALSNCNGEIERIWPVEVKSE
jgi:hypothetical protein